MSGRWGSSKGPSTKARGDGDTSPVGGRPTHLPLPPSGEAATQ